MDVCVVIKERLEELGVEQKDLAAAAEVTESYISQLLTRKKSPPRPIELTSTKRWASFSRCRAVSLPSWLSSSAGKS